MVKMDYPPGLIRYTTERQLDAPTQAGSPIHHLIRLRTLIYAALLLGVISFIAVSMINRVPLRMELIRDRNALYRPLGDDRVENVYTMKVVNMTDQTQRYRVSVEPAFFEIDRLDDIVIDAGRSRAIVVEIVAELDAGQGGQTLTLTLTDDDQPDVLVRRESRFFFPIEARPVTTEAPNAAKRTGDPS